MTAAVIMLSVVLACLMIAWLTKKKVMTVTQNLSIMFMAILVAAGIVYMLVNHFAE